MTTTTKPRPYISDRHLWDTIASEAGAIAVWPQTSDRIYFDAAKSNHLPANLSEGDHGSTVVDIGHGVLVRASGSAYRQGARWVVEGQWFPSQYPTGRDLTKLQDERAREVFGELITEWARTHEGDIAQADDIDRNNGARHLEEQIARHEEAITILREQLHACEEGEPFTQFPDLPTKR